MRISSRWEEILIMAAGLVVGAALATWLLTCGGEVDGMGGQSSPHRLAESRALRVPAKGAAGDVDVWREPKYGPKDATTALRAESGAKMACLGASSSCRLSA